MDINETICKAIRLIIENKVEWIDLGLPSGTLWAKEPINAIGITPLYARKYFNDFLPSHDQLMEILEEYNNFEGTLEIDDQEETTNKWILRSKKNGQKIEFPAHCFTIISKPCREYIKKAPAIYKKEVLETLNIHPSGGLMTRAPSWSFGHQLDYDKTIHEKMSFFFLPCKPAPRKHK